MKYIAIVFLSLILIVLGVLWFVNAEFRSLARTTQGTTQSNQPSQPTRSDNTWQFAVIGDTEGIHPVTRSMIEDIKKQPVEFVIHLGDIAPTGEEADLRAVKALFDTLPMPTYYVPGNNDLSYDETLEIKTPERYKKIINDELYYSFDRGAAHVVLLDNSYRRYGFPDDELEWLRADLDANTKPLTFLFYHRPLDLPGQELIGDDETTFSRGQNEKFKTLIADYTISHIFNGHIHLSFPYTLNDIPVTVTGGGGGLPQQILGGEDSAFYHYYIVTVDDGDEDSNIAPSYSLEIRDFN